MAFMYVIGTNLVDFIYFDNYGLCKHKFYLLWCDIKINVLLDAPFPLDKKFNKIYKKNTVKLTETNHEQKSNNPKTINKDTCYIFIV